MHDAILIGASTVTKDDPLLTVRHLKGNNPVRVIIDGRLSSAVDSKVFTQPPKTLLYVSETEVKETKHKIAELTARGIEIIQLQGRHGRLNIKSVLKDLAHRNIASVFVEGGQKIYSACISAKAVDKLYLFTAKKKFGSGLKTFAENSVSFKKRIRTEKRFGTDVFQEYDITFP
jgi:diaminohydroxyphosphoribosylaminopyrimidine deaminase/5-amino-6-(5-phosphoribosylamino)uracil reductase